MWKQFLKNTWLLAVCAVLGISGVLLYLYSRGSMDGDAFLGNFAALICMGILFILSLSCVGADAVEVSQWFRVLILLEMSLALITMGTNTCEGVPELRGWNYLLELLLFSCYALLSYFFWRYIRREIEEEGAHAGSELPLKGWFMNLTGAVSLLILLLNGFSGAFFRIDEAGFYHRGPYFLACWICPAVMLLYSTVLILRQDLRLSWKLLHLTYPVLPVIIYPLQVLRDKVMPLNIAVTFSLLLMYCVNYMNRRKVLLQQKELLAISQREMLELEVQLMISQIQPHFLYNTIAMIRGLCREDPEAAADSLGYFSSFLRGSLHMMQEKECISIEEELKLVEAYMYLEQKRFGDRLEYIEDIEDVSFSLPAMTIEPILENAVHHGIEEKEEDGMVLLEVTEDEGDYIIRITDDGAGFDTSAPVDSKKHVGMTNVRERLRTMCGGTLAFESVIGEGTTAVIRIPKGNQ